MSGVTWSFLEGERAGLAIMKVGMRLQAAGAEPQYSDLGTDYEPIKSEGRYERDRDGRYVYAGTDVVMRVKPPEAQQLKVESGFDQVAPIASKGKSTKKTGKGG